MTINSFLALIGTSKTMNITKDLDELISKFDINTYSKSQTTYIPEELDHLNRKLIASWGFKDVAHYLQQNNLNQIDENFWLAVRSNIHTLAEIKEWWQICHAPIRVKNPDQSILDIAANTLPDSINESTWSDWIKNITKNSGKKGKDLYIPLRIALTGQANGPELKTILPLIERDEILRRLK
jgi:glutamyl-tRNA synthetase